MTIYLKELFRAVTASGRRLIVRTMPAITSGETVGCVLSGRASMSLKRCYFLAFLSALLLGSEVVAQAPSTVWGAR